MTLDEVFAWIRAASDDDKESVVRYALSQLPDHVVEGLLDEHNVGE